jgi:hypothetical protein
VNGLIGEDFIQRLKNVIDRGRKLCGQTRAAELLCTAICTRASHGHPAKTEANAKDEVNPVPHGAFFNSPFLNHGVLESSIVRFIDDQEESRSAIPFDYHASARVALFPTFFARVESTAGKQ